MYDHHIRSALKQQLASEYASDQGTVISDELSIENGAARVDVVVISTVLHGFEIKSDQDTLRRLPEQVRIYSSVLDRVTLVVGYAHAYEAFQIVPEWWGVRLAHMEQDRVTIDEARDPRANPMLDPLAMAKLLRRDEALTLLEDVGHAEGVRSEPRSVIYERVVNTVELGVLHSRVCRQLRRRIGGRFGATRELDDG